VPQPFLALPLPYSGRRALAGAAAPEDERIPKGPERRRISALPPPLPPPPPRASALFGNSVADGGPVDGCGL
jgi:hypothetical protein